MSEIDVYEVVKKLVGPINPVGESHTDKNRFENLKVMTELVDCLLTDINAVSYKNKDRVEASMKKAGNFASKFFDEIGIKE